jgi:hypothetical protein
MSMSFAGKGTAAREEGVWRANARSKECEQ